MDPLLHNVQDPDAYGPTSLIDELVQVPFIDPGSPQPVPGASLGDSTFNSIINAPDNSQTSVQNFINSGTIQVGGVAGALAKKYDSKLYRVQKLVLTNATTNQLLKLNGTFIQVVWAATWTVGSNGTLLDADAVRGAADSSVMLSMKMNDINAEDIPMAPGFILSGVPFKNLYLSWPAQASKVVELLIIDDQPSDRVDGGN